VEFERLRALADLAHHRWDLVILALLAERPMRYRELSQRTCHRSERIADGVLSRTLRRLEQGGLVARATIADGSAVYRLTAAALTKVEQFRRVEALLAEEAHYGGGTKPIL
jgi:DNA-binding HxlR family transcriptional regulator